MNKVNKYLQPAYDIYKYKAGFTYSIKYKLIYLEDGSGYTKPYKAGRIAGHKQNKLTNLLKGNK